MTSPSRPSSPDAVRRSLLLGGAAAVTGLLAFGLRRSLTPARAATNEHFEVTHTDEEWKTRLTPDQYAVLRHEATEPPYSSPLEREHRKGTFHCAGCDNALFSSVTKFESGTGWPSFYKPLPQARSHSACVAWCARPARPMARHSKSPTPTRNGRRCCPPMPTRCFVTG